MIHNFSKIVMIKYLKLLLLMLVFTAISANNLQAQQDFSQENETVNKPQEVKKYAYQFMGEFSLVHLGINFDLTDSYKGHNICIFGFNLINNMVYKEKTSIGLGIGMEYAALKGEMTLPFFTDFRYYFSEKDFKPFINVGVGTVFIIHFSWAGFFGSHSKDIFIYKPGLYLNCSGGFKIGHFQLNAGINIKKYERIYYNNKGNTLDLNFVLKLGFNF